MLKDTVLASLLKSDGFVSGSSVSHDLQVSRAAVNQAVKALRAEGYEIESVTNRGYRLVSGPDRITAGSLQALLGKERMTRILCYDSTDSTNRRLQEAVLEDNAPHGLAAVANEQTAGRGRLGRTFSSPHDMGIYLSLLIRPDGFTGGPASWTILTSWTAVAICRAIENVCGVKPGIKWVNDLLLEGRKICGILTQMELESESAMIRDIIIGIGVNVQEQEKDFPEEIRHTAGSLYMATGRKTDRTALAAEMIRQLDRMCEDWFRAFGSGTAADTAAAPAYLEAYRERSVVIGKPVLVITPKETKEAIAESIGDDFSLHVRYTDGTEEDLRGGEISIRSTSAP